LECLGANKDAGILQMGYVTTTIVATVPRSLAGYKGQKELPRGSLVAWWRCPASAERPSF